MSLNVRFTFTHACVIYLYIYMYHIVVNLARLYYIRNSNSKNNNNIIMSYNEDIDFECRYNIYLHILYTYVHILIIRR